MKDNKILFTVIVPTFNRAHMIVETINSVLAQDYPFFELIIVDDGSTDNTEEIVKALRDDRIVYHKKKHEERAVARNTGFQMAKGDFVTLLDSDDYLYPNHLSSAESFITQHPDAEIIRFKYDIIDKKKNSLTTANIPDSINEAMIQGNYLGCSGILLSRNIIINHRFNNDLSLSGSEDYELWLRLSARYPIYTSEIITSTLNAHAERSVIYNIQEESLVNRIELLIKYSFEDKEVMRIYGKQKNDFVSKCLLYVSLHLAIAQYRKSSLKYLYKALQSKPDSLFDIRVLGILKTLIFRPELNY